MSEPFAVDARDRLGAALTRARDAARRGDAAAVDAAFTAVLRRADEQLADRALWAARAAEHVGALPARGGGGGPGGAPAGAGAGAAGVRAGPQALPPLRGGPRGRRGDRGLGRLGRGPAADGAERARGSAGAPAARPGAGPPGAGDMDG